MCVCLCDNIYQSVCATICVREYMYLSATICLCDDIDIFV